MGVGGVWEIGTVRRKIDGYGTTAAAVDDGAWGEVGGP